MDGAGHGPEVGRDGRARPGDVALQAALAVGDHAGHVEAPQQLPDVAQRQGAYPPPKDASPILGLELSGEVVAIGPGVTGYAIGDKVCGLANGGAYAEYCLLPAGQALPFPKGYDAVKAAALPETFFTVWANLFQMAGLTEGESVLIHGGSGSVGRAAIQLARRLGARVVATASPANHERLRELGAHPVAYGPGLVDRLRAAAPDGYDRILDAAGTDEALEASFELVDDRHRIGTIVAGPRAAELGILAWGGGNPVPMTPEELALRDDAYPLALDLIAAGEFEVDVARTFPLREAAEAARLVEGGHPGGKVLLLP